MWETNVVEERLAHNSPHLSEAWTVRGPQLGYEALARALECEEFELHYQPQVELRTGRWVGLEARLRWRHPEYGLLSPELFLPSLGFIR